MTTTTAGFKAKAVTLDTPSLLVLWETLKADDTTSLELLIWTGAEYERRVRTAAKLETRCRHCGEQVGQGTGGDTACRGLDGIPVPDGHEPYVVGEG